MPFSLDPEGLVLTKDRRLILTSEGLPNNLIDPFVRRYALDGTFRSSLPVPQPFLATADRSSGVRPNLGFESAGVPRHSRYAFTATENALYQDGPVATLDSGSPARILRYDLRKHRLDRQWVYETDPVAQPPMPATQFSVNGLVELLPLDDDSLIAMERSFSVGAPGPATRSSSTRCRSAARPTSTASTAFRTSTACARRGRSCCWTWTSSASRSTTSRA